MNLFADKTAKFFAVALSGLAMSSWFLCSLQATGAPTSQGESTFKAKCMICHGTDGSGNTTLGKTLGAPDLRSSQVQDKSDDQLLESIMRGKGGMPAFGKRLGPSAIRQVVSHVRNLKR
jgi:mono/diheme cytochrome c family protein